MAGNLIVTTPKISMHALAYQGIMVYTCFPQIRDLLIRKFGDEFVLLFAKPVENTGDGQIDWYTPVQGEARRLADLPDAEKGAVYDRLASMGQEISRFAEELIASGRSQNITRGNILKLALQYPDENALYMVGQQPVFTCWGFGPGTPGVEGQYLTRIPQKVDVAKSVKKEEPLIKTQKTEFGPAPATAVVAATTPFGWAWLWWLFPLLAALLLFLALCTSFPGFPALSGYSLFNLEHTPFLRHGDRGEEIIRLERETAELEGKLNTLIAQCKPESQPEQPLAKAPEIPEQAQPLVIPKKDGDLSFLEGEWLCRTGLGNAETGEPVEFAFSFNKHGRGIGTVYEKNDQCAGNATGKLEDGILLLNLDEQKCAQSPRSYGKLTIQCKNAMNKGATECHGVNQDGSRWDATFYRLR